MFRSIQFYFCLGEENNKFEFYTDKFDELSFTDLKDEVAEIFGFSKTTSKLLQRDILGLRNIEACEKLGSEMSSTDGYFLILFGLRSINFSRV